MGTKKRVNKYPKAFRLMALERMKNCESVSALAEELGIHRTVLYHWKNHLKAMEGGTADSPVRELRKQVRDLKRELARVSRAGFYRSLQERASGEEDVEVRSAIQRIALEHRRRYGYRRVTAELRRRGLLVNHKRVRRMMQEDNLLAVQPRAFVRSTDSSHGLEIYLNLARRMTLTGIDQLWVADITYIRLRAEFVYLAVILDGFSRKVVGWKLDRTLASCLAIDALAMAIDARKPLPGLVHHSDRGIQYASGEYVAILKKHAIVPSMSRPANPYDNASCESFIKTLKREEIYANEYENLDDLRDHLEEFIERYYNQKRLHSALGYRSPEEFEQQTECVAALCSATVRFFARKDDKSSTELLGEGTPSAVPSPRPHPCWRINNMSYRNDRVFQSVEASFVSCEGSL